jgi:hypothetical protein
MELIIVLAIVGMIIAYLVMQRRKETTVVEQPAVGQPYLDPAAPYKVESTPTPATEAVVEVAAVEATAEVAAPIVVEDKPAAPKARKPRKPKAVVAVSTTEAVKKPRKPRSKQV